MQEYVPATTKQAPLTRTLVELDTFILLCRTPGTTHCLNFDSSSCILIYQWITRSFFLFGSPGTGVCLITFVVNITGKLAKAIPYQPLSISIVNAMNVYTSGCSFPE